eukprot:6030710-Prymnesium_polylepis.1
MSEGVSRTVVEIAQDQSSQLVSSFRFFPTFLMLGLLKYMADRWRERLVNSHTVQAPPRRRCSSCRGQSCRCGR